jgi:hypothetical protein
MAGLSDPPPIEGDPRRRLLRRIEREAGVPGLATVLADRLSPSDLQSLLLEVYARRAERRRPQDLLKDHLTNRFAHPSPGPSKLLHAWDSLAWSMLPSDFEPVELAPVGPLGMVSVLAPLSQDWSIATSRNTEVVSDATNVLALEASARRKDLLKTNPTSSVRVHLATSHRLLRGQRFGEGPGIRQHFRLFAMCSAGRDMESLRFETEMARRHITFFVRTVKRYLGARVGLRVAVAALEERSSRKVIEASVLDVLRETPDAIPVGWEEATPQGRAYYSQLRFHLYAQHPTLGEIELVDGGSVDWSRKLVNSEKERMFISGIGSERLAQLFEPAVDSQPTIP